MESRNWLICGVLFIMCTMCSHVNAEINMTEYYKMPPIYNAEPYDRCLNEYPQYEAVYCIVAGVIAPNRSNSVWNIIENVSSNHKRHYRHDKISRGICMNWCRKKMKYYDHQTRMNYNLQLINNTDMGGWDPNIFRNALIHRAKYQQLSNMCLNFELKRQYELMAHSTVIYCISNRDEIEIDTADELFILLLAAVILVVTASTCYDFYLKRNNLPHLCNMEHYRRPVPNMSTKFLVTFSLVRNWYRLIGDSNDEYARDLRPLNALKFMTMYGVMLAHVAIFMSIVPVVNPEFLESQYYGVWSMLVINGANVLQMFFAVTGYLMSIQFMAVRENTKFSWSILWISTLYRYLRYAPAYAFVIFFHATWLAKLHNGPIYPYMADTERSFCRENWWTNLLFINNFVNPRQPCAQHTWYLAADLQLAVLGSFIHMLIWRFPKWTKEVLGFAVIISFIIPGYVVYVNRLEGIFMATPEKQRYSHLFDPAYISSYIPFYMNIGSFVLGNIGGILYCENKKGNINLKKNKLLVVSWYSTVPLAIFALLSGNIFYLNDFEKPSLWISLYAGFIRNIWGIFLSVIVTGIAMGTGWIVRDIFRLPVFRTLGRLTFGAYLLHPMIMRAMNGNIRLPFFVTHFRILENVSSLFVASFVLSLMLALIIELPFTSIQKLLFMRAYSSSRGTDKDNHTQSDDSQLSKATTLELNVKISPQ